MPSVMAAALEERKACSVCQVARPVEAFSKKQFKAKAHERTCLVCAGLSKETGAPGIRIGDTVLLHSLQAVEYNGLVGVVAAALNGVLARACPYSLTRMPTRTLARTLRPDCTPWAVQSEDECR